MVWLPAPSWYVVDELLDLRILGSGHSGKASDRTAYPERDVAGGKTGTARVDTLVKVPLVVVESRMAAARG